MYEFVVKVLSLVGWLNGLMAIVFGWLIASGNAAPSAANGLALYAAMSATCYLSAATLVLVRHA